MIPHPSAGVQNWAQHSRAPSAARPADLAAPRLDKPSMATAPLSLAQQSVIDLTANEAALPDTEHLNKKPRLDTTVSGLGGPGTATPTATKSADPRSATANGAIARPTPVSARGRPAYSFQDLVTETYGGNVFTGNPASGGSQTPKPPSPPPFPARPWKYGSVSHHQATNVAAPAQEGIFDRQVQTTPYHSEVPANAPALTADKVADYFPWSQYGNHPEDNLTDHAVKNGYYDKQPPSNCDVQAPTCKLSSQLKNRSSLQLLSSVFAAALEKRQAHNKIASTSTFKPPPRVTLTDNKREAWLRDLANPSVNLRRLSRTIPHGIRGKVLLDQCLSKGVPIGRAIWLAKCVGANEIRAFKRKGTSGPLSQGLEIKWVREWTASVQLFIEGVIQACGKEGWKQKITYAVRLAARLFFENLLDQDCFLDWYLSCLENSTLDATPVWLLMLGVYWESLARFRKRGRRMAEALLEKLRQAHAVEPRTTYQPLIDRLVLLVRRLCRECSSSLVLPRSWDQYRDLVSSSLDVEDVTEKAILEIITTRNARVKKQKDCRQSIQRSPHQQIIKLLDTALSTYDVPALSLACLDAMKDREALVHETLEWAASRFRHGLVRVYITVRLLRKWKRLGMDIDGYIFSFIMKARSNNSIHMVNVQHVIVELIRSQTFSVSRYLQWLVARGAVEQYCRNSSESSTIPVDIELLSHIPINRLPRHLRNLRDMLMNRAGLVVSEKELSPAIKSDLKQRLPEIFETDDSDDTMHRDVDYSRLTWAVKAEIGQWIRGAVSEHYGDDPRHGVKGYESGVESSSLTHEEFVVIRSTLEEYGDIAMLADVLIDASNSDDVRVLVSAVDTLNRHFSCFTVIGALNDLFRNFYGAFLRVKQYGEPLYDLAYSLVEVGHRLPNELNAIILLRQELSRGDRKLAVAACSPVSDHMAETLNDANPSFNDDMDQFLSSGNSMDESTLIIVFQKLIQQLINSHEGKEGFTTETTCRHLVQLRSFNPKQFDLLLIQWIGDTIKSSTRPKLSRFLGPLIGIGCVTLPGFTLLVKKLSHEESEIPALPDFQLDFLGLILPSAENRFSSQFLSYRFELAQEEFLSKHANEVFTAIQDTAATMTRAPANDDASLQQLWSKRTVPLLREILVRHSGDDAQNYIHVMLKENPAALGIARDALDQLLNFDSEPSRNENSLSEAESTINMADNFSLPFCQMKLQMLFNTEAGDDVRNSIVDVMFKSAVADVQAGQTHWLDLVTLMSQEAVEQVRQKAENSFFAVAQSDSSLDGASDVDRSAIHGNAKVYLSIVDGLADSIPEGGVPSIGPVLVEKMNTLLQKLIMIQMTCRNLREDPSSVEHEQIARTLSICEESFLFWFTAMLRMVKIHRAAFDQPWSPTLQRPNALLDQSRLLVSICCLALSPLNLTSRPPVGMSSVSISAVEQKARVGNTIQTYALDIASSLIDTLPDEARVQCARFLKERCPPFLHVQNEPRLLYLFGPVSDVILSSNQSVSGSSPAPSGAISSALTPSANPPAANTGVVAAPAGISEDPNSMANRLRVQSRGRVVGPYYLRSWELLEEAAPVVGANDTAVDLNFFGARKAKRRCDLRHPACRRCVVKGIECHYVSTRLHDNGTNSSNSGVNPKRQKPKKSREANVLVRQGQRQGLGHGHSSADDILLSLMSDSSPEEEKKNTFPILSAMSNNNAFSYPFYNSYECQFFLTPTSWHVTNPGHRSTPRPGWKMSHLHDSVQQVLRWVKQWVEDGSNAFIHRYLYSGKMPKCIQDAYTASAAYFGCNERNRELVLGIIEDRVRMLLEEQEEGSEWSWKTGGATATAAAGKGVVAEHLARVQALLVYQVLRLLDGDTRQRSLAEGLIPTLQGWSMQMLECALLSSQYVQQLAITDRDMTINPAPAAQKRQSEWQAWILAESVRRTWLVAGHTQCIYGLLRNGISLCPGGLMFTTRAGLWQADSADEWWEMCWQKDVLFCHSLETHTQLVKKARPHEVDDFGRFVMRIISEKEEVERMWLQSV
ncbi:Mediator of RNA polymerase II transcription subunit 12 [Talaromyces islandicus]|uniref:Mediator of RNA polymerase II transcription subunit 12 n=1 Tax=Talaromyces islandicus TaxID=28573 RepID=A0A0U1LKX7_TALIS|nr:Mediator of RNA polymerase II transcription subunit 12 [Talaromyces islandicus]